LICTGQIKDYNTLNSHITDNTVPTGWYLLYESLYAYNACKEKDSIIPWIAVGHEYNYAG